MYSFLFIQRLSDQVATAQERYEEDESIVGCSVQVFPSSADLDTQVRSG